MTGYAYDAYAMGMPLHSHRDIHIIMSLMVIVIGQVIHRHRYASTHSFVFSLVSEIDVVRLGIALIQWSRSMYYLGEAASDLHVLSSFHSLNALPMTMYIHYTSDSLSVARLSLAYWQNMSDMCYQVESGIICSQNGQLSKQWTIAKN